MNRKKLFLTIFSSGIAFAINYLISFYLTSFITKNIGTEAYGYVTLAKTVASYALIATTALNSYAARYIALAYHKGDFKKANIYYNSVFFADTMIGIILFALCLSSSAFIKSVFYVSNELVNDVKILFILMFANLFVNLSNTVLQAAAIIKDKLLTVSICKGLSYIVEAFSLITIYFMFPAKIYYVGIGMVLSSLVFLVSNALITINDTPELKINIKDFRINSVKELVFNGFWNSLNSLGNTLNSGLDLIVTNVMLGALTMGQVSIVKTINNIFSSLYQMVAQPFQPNFLKLYAVGDKNELLKQFTFSAKISGLISNLAFAGVVAYGECYYRLWIPQENCLLLYRLTIISTATSIFEGVIYPLYYIYTLTVKNKIPCIITIIGGLFNVMGMCVLINNTNLKAYAVFLTTAVIMLLINGISNPIYMAYCLNIHWISFYPLLLRHILSCASMTIVISIISHILQPVTWIGLISIGAISCIIGGVIHVLIMFDMKEIKFVCKKIIDKNFV